MHTLQAKDTSIPALGLGTWQVTGARCAQCVREALEIGYRHVDTARAYENEEDVGRGLREASVPREEVFLTTKLWFDDMTREAVLRAGDESLKRLGTDHLDLLLIHWPNPEVPLEETLEGMCELQRREKVRHLGVSNFPVAWLERAAKSAPIVCDQVEYHPLLSQRSLLADAARRDIALVAYSPLAHGRVLEEEPLAEIGAAHDKSAAPGSPALAPPAAGSRGDPEGVAAGASGAELRGLRLPPLRAGDGARRRARAERADHRSGLRSGVG